MKRARHQGFHSTSRHNMDWNPEKYAKGNYFQSQTSEAFRQTFAEKPFGSILDVGCGDGEYTRFLANQLQSGHVTGIDSSADMVCHANRHWASPNLSFEVQTIDQFHTHSKFDFILSFWCLHWTNIELSFTNIFNALKNNGRVYAIFSSFSDNSIYQTCYELAKRKQYAVLTEGYINTNNDYNKNYFYHVLNTLNQLPFKDFKLNLQTTQVYFPDISYFKNLLLTMPFIQRLSSADNETIIEDLVEVYQDNCNRKHGGKLYYETRPIYLAAVK